MYENAGKTIRNGRIINSEHDLHIEALAPGTYYISLVDTNGITKKLRFVKE